MIARRIFNRLLDGDESGQVLAAWIIKEELRDLLALAKHQPERDQIRRRLWRYLIAFNDEWVPELTSEEVREAGSACVPAGMISARQ